MGSYEVFLSFKNLDEYGKKTIDAKMAEELYTELTRQGINTFFSNASLEKMGVAQYKQAIDQALDEAKILVVIGTSIENLNSNWVRYEWDGFYSDILSGQKKGEMFSYIDCMENKDLPRTLRQLQSFCKNSSEIGTIIMFICHALGRNVIDDCLNNDETVLNKNMDMSRRKIAYSYADHREKDRLSCQAKLVYENDITNLKGIFDTFGNDTLNVLDLGCSDGYLTKLIFDAFENKVNRVIGVDWQEVAISFAQKYISNGRYQFYQINLESADWEEKLDYYMKECNIKKFDIIFSALLIHHLNNPEKLMRKLRHYLSEDGYLYIRTTDDGEIIAYPDENDIVKTTIEKSGMVEGCSDRLHGRKLYGQLYHSGYRNIQIKNYYVTTAEMDTDERENMFFSLFQWRKNRYKKRVDLYPENEKFLKEYNEYCRNMEMIEEAFVDPDFYFSISGPIAIVKK